MNLPPEQREFFAQVKTRSSQEEGVAREDAWITQLDALLSYCWFMRP